MHLALISTHPRRGYPPTSPMHRHHSLHPQEDAKLIVLVDRNGPKQWRTIANDMDGRTSKSCRLR
jgi:hypothetical protein